MIPKLKKVKYVEEYRIYLEFEDGVCGEIDLKGELTGEIFEPLKDKSFFKKFKLNSELNTITWPNGADLAPEFLYKKAQKKAA